MSDTLVLTVDMDTSTAHRLSHYDGVCSSIHGHNMGWEAEVTFHYDANYEDNMAEDFKDISDVIDEVDHALLLNKEDPIAQERLEYEDEWTWLAGDQSHPVVGWTKYNSQKYGTVFVFNGDPTVEILSEWMMCRILTEFDDAFYIQLHVSETDKYKISREAGERKYE